MEKGRVFRVSGLAPAVLALAAAGLLAQDLRVTLPAVASLHGPPPTFFHSDVWILNGSALNEATVTATYRCATGACGDSVQTFTIPPRQARFFSDIVGTLFHAPDTFGAIELDSAQLIVVTSRLYTPARPDPTVGMFVRGMAASEAHAISALTGLSHDEFLRTNVGVYNPTDVTVPVLFEFHGSGGGFIGQFFANVRAHRSFQLNDPELVAQISVPGELSDFYCRVIAAGPVFSYASVIDRNSQDPIFIPGANAEEEVVAKTTIPAVAHVQGFGNTFFQSDVRILNLSSAELGEVTVRFVCPERGECGQRSFFLNPGQMIAWDDVVTSLFQTTSLGGALELVSEVPIVVTSRLYTPIAIPATHGMFVPGLPPESSSPAVVLNGLSHPSDFFVGSRVNVGVFNQADVAQVVTYRLFDGNGHLLGQTARFFGPREWFQVNDVFGFMNVSQSVESAYCLVEGSELFPLFAYAAVVDNRSQDPIFIPGEDDPEHPPITPFEQPK